jgi:hypothetical protein
MSRYPNRGRTSAYVEKDSDSGSFPLPQSANERIKDNDKRRDARTEP